MCGLAQDRKLRRPMSRALIAASTPLAFATHSATRHRRGTRCSMSSTLVRRVLSGEVGTPKKVIVFSRDEAKQHEMRMSYLHRREATDDVIFRNFMNVLEFRIGDVRSFPEICAAVRDADIVVNAAALKQVPTCEYFPEQALLTNCVGALNIVRAIQ